jgi:hypothetical protein
LGRFVYEAIEDAHTLEPPPTLHLSSQTIVDAKRADLSNQSIINGLKPVTTTNNFRQPKPLAWTPNHVKQPLPFKPTTRFAGPVVNGFGQAQKQKPTPSFMSQDRVMPANPFEPSLQSTSTPKAPTPSFGDDDGSKSILKSPVPKRAIKSPILSFQTLPSTGTSNSNVTTVSNIFAKPINQNPQSQSPAPFAFSTPPISLPMTPSIQAPKVTAANLTPSLSPANSARSIDLTARRQSRFERQEKLLHDELAHQDRERKSTLALHEQERLKSLEQVQQWTLERTRLREKESALLQSQKLETQERHRHEYILSEQRKQQMETTVQFYADEIVHSIVQEHILEVNAGVLAVAFHRRVLLGRILRRLRKICKRSVLRKQVQLERIAAARIRKTLVDRALAELDHGGSSLKKPRRRSQRARPVETEEEFNELLSKVSGSMMD